MSLSSESTSPEQTITSSFPLSGEKMKEVRKE